MENNISNLALRKFASEKEKYKSVIKGNEDKVQDFFNKTLDNIMLTNPISLSLGLTRSESIYFRFNNFSLYETHLEIFYTKENDDDITEAVTTVYKNNEVVLKQYGQLNEVFHDLKKTLLLENSGYEKVESKQLVSA